MSAPFVEISGLALPAALVRAIDSGSWGVPVDPDIVRQVFADDPDWPRFYSLAEMIRETQLVQRNTAKEFETLVPGSQEGLGFQPERAVFIASLGADMPVVLDYRLSGTSPRVIYLGSDGWREIAPDIETLLALLTP